MTLNEFAARLDGARRSGNGILARCHAHADKSPSLSVKEGDRGILIKCWSGCTPHEIVTALGLTLNDLFYDNDTPRHLRKPVPPKPRIDLNKTAFRLRFHADLLYLRARSVLDAAASLDVTTWGDDALARAVNSVASAYADLERVALLDGVAFDLRCRQLKSEMHHAA
jgi:hypothetical protein